MKLFVIIGAGASKGCASDAMPKGTLPEEQFGGTFTLPPPLMPELFASHYLPVLSRYPLAQSAGAEIRKAGTGAVTIERFIRETYRDSADPIDQRKYRAIPVYLQELLYWVSRTYTPQPDNFDILLAALLRRLEEVVFVTLNYDTFLEDRLEILDASRIRGLDDYLSTRWALIKLHGSVDWGHPVAEMFDERDPGLNIEIDPAIVSRRGNEKLRNMRFDGTTWFYPALAVPVGEEDELVCPPEHVDFLRDQMASETEGLDLLVLGYSAVDQEVLKLLKDSGQAIRSLMVVNADEATAWSAASRIQNYVADGAFLDVSAFAADFSSFIQRDDGLDEYIDRLIRDRT